MIVTDLIEEDGTVEYTSYGKTRKVDIDDLIAAYKTLHDGCIFCCRATKGHDSEYCSTCVRNWSHKDRYERIEGMKNEP